MLIEESERRQNVLEQYLREMASSSMDDEKVLDMAVKLRDLYLGGFRHNYSGFFPIIVDIAQPDNGMDLEFLSNNIENVRHLVEKDHVEGGKEFKWLYKPLSKLSDHVNLEIARYAYYSINEQKLQDMEAKNKTLNADLIKARQELMVASKQAHDMQTQYTTILGIFASVIIGFIGSFTFSTGVLDHVAEANVHQLVLVVLLVGFFFYNMIASLLGFLREINSWKLGSVDDGSPHKRKKNWKFWIINALIILMLLIDIVAWGVSGNNQKEARLESFITVETPSQVQ